MGRNLVGGDDDNEGTLGEGNPDDEEEEKFFTTQNLGLCFNFMMIFISNAPFTQQERNYLHMSSFFKTI